MAAVNAAVMVRSVQGVRDNARDGVPFEYEDSECMYTITDAWLRVDTAAGVMRELQPWVRNSDATIRCGAQGCYGKGLWEFLYGSGRPRGLIVPKE